jgi:hypothetical protein
VSFAIVIVDVDVGTPKAELARAASALQRQILEHFFPSWGVSATVRAAATSGPAGKEDWILELRRTPTIEGVLGIHQVTATGMPLMLDFPLLDARDGVPWTVTASHEALETLADPWLRRGVQDDDGAWWAIEICDAVEADTYVIDGITVSNFCLPTWGEPPLVRSGVRYDHLGLCKQPWEVREGGYAQRFDARTNAWTQIGSMRPARRELHNLGLGRASRR